MDIVLQLLENCESENLKYEPKYAVVEPVDTQYFHCSLGMPPMGYNN